MKETYNKEYSWIMDRDMEYAVFGESGKVMFAFAPQNGHTYDFASFGMVETVSVGSTGKAARFRYVMDVFP